MPDLYTSSPERGLSPHLLSLCNETGFIFGASEKIEGKERPDYLRGQSKDGTSALKL